MDEVQLMWVWGVAGKRLKMQQVKDHLVRMTQLSVLDRPNRARK